MSIKVDHGKRSRQVVSTGYLSIIVNRQVKFVDKSRLLQGFQLVVDLQAQTRVKQRSIV